MNTRKEIFLAPLYLSVVICPLFYIEVFRDPYLLPKWDVLYISTILAGLVLVFQANELLLPRLSRNQLFAFFLIILTFTFNLFYHQSSPLSVTHLRPFCFVLLFIYLFNAIALGLVSERKLSQLIAVPMVLLTTLNLLSISVSGDSPWRLSLSSIFSFGNPNLLSEYLGLGLLIYFCLVRKSGKAFSFLDLSLIAATVVIFGFTMTRSVLQALGCALPFLLFKRKKWASFLISGIMLVVSNYFFITNRFAKYSVSQTEFKDDSVHSRLEFWQNTLKIFKDHPLGIGSGQLEFSYLPYSLDSRYSNWNYLLTNPHNEILRWLVEEGFLYVIACLIFIIFMSLSLCNRLPGRTFRFLLAFLVFIGVQSSTQFPFLSAPTYFLIVLTLALVLSSHFPISKVRLNLKSKVFILILSVTFTLFAFLSVGSRYLDFNSTNELQADWACRLDSSNWRACLSAVNIEMQMGLFSKAEDRLKGQLVVHPYNYVALDLLKDITFRKWDWDLACEQQNLLNHLFRSENQRRRVPLCEPTPFIDELSFRREYGSMLTRMGIQKSKQIVR